MVSEVLSSVVVDPTCMEASIKFGDYRSNHSRDIDCLKCVTNNIYFLSYIMSKQNEDD